MFTVLLAAIAVDFAAETGTIRPALHSSGFGPTVCSQTERDLEDVKSMGFKYARTHDWALIGGNQRICDYFHIFPLPHLDAKDPKNYYFKPTDYILKRTREDAGLDILFRLGTSIEHSGKKHHFNISIRPLSSLRLKGSPIRPKYAIISAARQTFRVRNVASEAKNK